MADHPQGRRLDIQLLADFLAHRRQGLLTRSTLAIGFVELVHNLDAGKVHRQAPAAALLAAMLGHYDRVVVIIAGDRTIAAHANLAQFENSDEAVKEGRI